MTSSMDGYQQVGDRPAEPAESTALPRPGWPELIAAAVTYLILYGVTYAILHSIPDNESVKAGLVGYALSALMGLAAFGAAYVIRIRDVRAFGVRRVPVRWIVLGFVIGAVAWWLNIFVAAAYAGVTGQSSPQGDYQAASGAGAGALLATLVLGAVATPIGEELAFRGVLANALNRYGWWAGVLVSSGLFAWAHGINPVLPVAFVIGVCCALLFRRTGSIWPGVFVHLANNASAILLPLLLTQASS